MALWLDLIPRIHRPEGAEFEPSHHQLDDHENLTSFEDDGLTKLDIKPLELDRVTQPTVEISSKTRSTRIQSKTPNLQSTEVKIRRTSSKPAGQLHLVTEPTAHVASTVARDQPKEVDSKADKISQEASGSISSVALTITVAFALVALNLLVFAAACCQLRRLKKTKELSAAGKGDVNADASETEYLRGREKGEQDMEIEPPSRNNSNYYTNTNSRHPSNSKSSGRHRSNSDCHSCNCNSTPQPPRKPSPHQPNSHNQHSQPPPPPPLQHRYALIIDGAETYLRHSDGEDDIDVMNGCVVEARSSSPTQSDQDSSTLV